MTSILRPALKADGCVRHGCRPALLVLFAGSLVLAGCTVQHSSKGQEQTVQIGTPFGSMHVDNTNAADTAAIGLSPYPGATPIKDGDGKDQDAANVDLSFGGFHLGVRAASFQTTATQQQVLDFYRKQLARYGDVIECRGRETVGAPVRTAQGLTCDSKQSGTHTDGGDLQLRAGSQQHQHVVGIESRDGGLRIALVALDLPTHLSTHGKEDAE